jgi:hypothetical protein
VHASVPPPNEPSDDGSQATLARLEQCGYQCKSVRFGADTTTPHLIFVRMQRLQGLKGSKETWVCVGTPDEILALDTAALSEHLAQRELRMRTHLAHKLLRLYQRTAKSEGANVSSPSSEKKRMRSSHMTSRICWLCILIRRLWRSSKDSEA